MFRRPSPSPVAKRQPLPTPGSEAFERRTLIAPAPIDPPTGLAAWGGGWAGSLFDAPGHGGGPQGKRRSSHTPSPAPGHNPRFGSGGARGGRGRVSQRVVEPQPREPSPPLTIDDIAFNPFPLFHIRWKLLPEVTLLVSALIFALLRLQSMSPTETFPAIPAIPFGWLFLYALVIPFIALFRRRGTYLKVPFTDERGYRDPAAADDGIACALVLPVLLSCATLWDTYSRGEGSSQLGIDGIRPLVHVWEAHGIHGLDHLRGIGFDPATLATPLASARALFAARHELVLLTALSSACLIFHLVLAKTVLKIEHLPKSNAKRFFGYMAVASLVSVSIYVGLAVWDWHRAGGLPISPLEAGAASFIQQASFYIISRLARRGFTLGELNTMTGAGNALCLEFWRLSRSRWFYKRGYPIIPPTFRSPTPVISFQMVLIPGAFLSGFLLSPLLVISRHIASRPAHRLKWPTERERHRRLLAAGVFLGLFGIVFFMLGGWAGWMLGGGLRAPWAWAVRLLVTGGDGVDAPGIEHGWFFRRRRMLLCAYWAGAIVVAVGGWQSRLVRARRIRMRGQAGPGAPKGGPPDKGPAPRASLRPELAKIGAELAREEKRVHASLNMRRKFFHALAVAMFVPGIAIDPAFTSIAFSVAFALFTFSEYARYFALYPVGAPLHIFFSEFTDSKDSGPVILSHFYLLSGCAGGLWLEGTSVNRFTGVLVLGVGDALASIVGKYLGRIHWPGSPKTVEGTLAFVGSILACAWLLRAGGLVEPFSMARYAVATCMAGLLEASSSQNDNLVIPIFFWSWVALVGC